MQQTALGVVKNFLEIIQNIGFVPNGGRIYYLNRSQPPLVIQMVSLYLSYFPDSALLQEALPLLETEYNYWMTYHNVTLSGGHTLNRYYRATYFVSNELMQILCKQFISSPRVLF